MTTVSSVCESKSIKSFGWSKSIYNTYKGKHNHEMPLRNSNPVSFESDTHSPTSKDGPWLAIWRETTLKFHLNLTRNVRWNAKGIICQNDLRVILMPTLNGLLQNCCFIFYFFPFFTWKSSTVNALLGEDSLSLTFSLLVVHFFLLL